MLPILADQGIIQIVADLLFDFFLDFIDRRPLGSQIERQADAYPVIALTHGKAAKHQLTGLHGELSCPGSIGEPLILAGKFPRPRQGARPV